jgi:hypothetical protein
VPNTRPGQNAADKANIPVGAAHSIFPAFRLASASGLPLACAEQRLHLRKQSRRRHSGSTLVSASALRILRHCTFPDLIDRDISLVLLLMVISLTRISSYQAF